MIKTIKVNITQSIDYKREIQECYQLESLHLHKREKLVKQRNQTEEQRFLNDDDNYSDDIVDDEMKTMGLFVSTLC